MNTFLVIEKVGKPPGYGKNAPDAASPEMFKRILSSERRKIVAAWCFSWQKHFYQGQLNKAALEKVYGINWDSGFATERWKESFLLLLKYLSAHGQLPPINHKLYFWAWWQKTLYASYSREKQLLLDAIKLDYYFVRVSWMERYGQLARYVVDHKKLPAEKDNLTLYRWIKNQKDLFRIGKLEQFRINQLCLLGIRFKIPLRQKDVWEQHYELLKRFLAENGRWPGAKAAGVEQKLYNWYRNQKQAMAGTLRNRKPLAQDKRHKLGEIGLQATPVRENIQSECFK